MGDAFPQTFKAVRKEHLLSLWQVQSVYIIRCSNKYRDHIHVEFSEDVE